jgi:hypothetical protein
VAGVGQRSADLLRDADSDKLHFIHIQHSLAVYLINQVAKTDILLTCGISIS